MGVKSIILSLLIVCPILLFSQQYKGSVKNKKTGENLSYVNIGIPSKGWGFLSNENGDFSFKVTSEKDTDTIQFSLIGYQPAILTFKDLKSKCEAGTAIYLNETIYDLATVSIIPNEYETKVLGNKNPEDLECGEIPKRVDSTYKQIVLEKGLDTNSIGFEFGNRISIEKGQRTFIDKVQFKVCLQPKDTAKYRINVYTQNDKRLSLFTLKNILKESIIINCYGKTEVITVDLSSQNIEVMDDFIVALECLYASDRKMKIGAAVSLFSSTDLLIRISPASQEWFKLPVGKITFVSATVSYKKKPGFWQRVFR